MTQQEFIDGYCKRSGVEWSWLSQYRFVAPCDCDAEECDGWQMAHKSMLTEDPKHMLPRELEAVEWHRKNTQSVTHITPDTTKGA